MIEIICMFVVIGGFALYVVKVERDSRRRFPDDQHEHGPFYP